MDYNTYRQMKIREYSQPLTENDRLYLESNIPSDYRKSIAGQPLTESEYNLLNKQMQQRNPLAQVYDDYIRNLIINK